MPAPRTPPDRIQAGYDLLFDGQKAAAAKHFEALLQSTPDDLAARSGWLTVQNERLRGDATLAPAFEKALDSLIELASARYSRSRQDSEALLYLAEGHFLRAEYKFDHDKGLFGAARDESKAKGYIDAYLKQHPEDNDTYFVLGLYNYYVDIAPSFIKVLRTFLFLPPGNRVEGLKQLERTSIGARNGPRAQMVLLDIYSSLENRPLDAVAVGERLRQRHPANDDVDFAMAEVYIERVAGGLRRGGRGVPAGHRSPPGGSVAGRIDRQVPRAARPRRRAPQPVAPRRSDRGVGAADRRRRHQPGLGPAAVPPAARQLPWPVERPGGGDDVKRVMDDPHTPKSWQTAAASTMKALDARKASGEAVVVAALLPGNRLTAEGHWEEARQVYEAVRNQYPQDAHVRYRLAYLDFAKGDPARALPALWPLPPTGQRPKPCGPTPCFMRPGHRISPDAATRRAGPIRRSSTTSRNRARPDAPRSGW